MVSRSELVRAVVEADRLHRDFGSRDRAYEGHARIDVFGMLAQMDVPLVLRPLNKLLGAFVRQPRPGVMITSRRPLPVQRFTAAHELGHLILGHEGSVDDEMIVMRSISTTRPSDPREVLANVFASHLLAPPWLLEFHIRRQGWHASDLARPEIVYQLSLRIGSSYTATCYALAESGVIDAKTRGSLITMEVRSIKQQLAGSYHPEDWYRDAWVVTERDDGMALEGSRADVVVMKLPEHTSSGYLWDFGDLRAAGLAIKHDVRTSDSDPATIGGIALRTVAAETSEIGGAAGTALLKERRSWQEAAEPLNSLRLVFDLSGPIGPGLLPSRRASLLATA